MYKTTQSGVTIGIYNCQRPSAAACKAFTTLRRKDHSLKTASIAVATEGRVNSTIYDVEYARVEDAFFGSIERPVATKHCDKPAAENSSSAVQKPEVEIRIPDAILGPDTGLGHSV